MEIYQFFASLREILKISLPPIKDRIKSEQTLDNLEKKKLKKNTTPF